MSKGGGSTTSTTAIDPDLKSAYLRNIGQAQSVAGALPVRQFAGFNPLYTAGEQQVTNEALNPFTGQSIQQFMNPYENEVVQRRLADVGGALCWASSPRSGGRWAGCLLDCAGGSAARDC